MRSQTASTPLLVRLLLFVCADRRVNSREILLLPHSLTLLPGVIVLRVRSSIMHSITALGSNVETVMKRMDTWVQVRYGKLCACPSLRLYASFFQLFVLSFFITFKKCDTPSPFSRSISSAYFSLLKFLRCSKCVCAFVCKRILSQLSTLLM